MVAVCMFAPVGKNGFVNYCEGKLKIKSINQINDNTGIKHHGIAVLTGQNDGGQEARHSTNRKHENEQPTEQHEKSWKVYQRAQKKTLHQTDLHDI